MEITNFAQLESVLNEYVRIGLESASERAIDKLLEFINEDVYSNSSSEWYERTYDLLDRDNWEAQIHKGIKGYTLDIHPVENGFTHNTSGLQHTNSTGNDIGIEQLVGILNDPMSMNFDIHLSWWYDYPKPFWDDFVDWFHNNFTEIIYEEIEKVKYI